MVVCVRFVRGLDKHSSFPDLVRRAGLNQRFAIIQDTHIQGHADMYFDEPLWRALIEFVKSKAVSGRVEVFSDHRKRASVPIELFLEDWGQTAAEERCPPPMVAAFAGERATLCMVTDNWAAVGGPALYHDSYTHSLFCDRDVELEVMTALTSAPGRKRWQFV